MARGGDAYSRFIALLTVILPLAALGLMAGLFLSSRTRAPDANTFENAAQIAADPHVGEPKVTGVAADGSTVSIVGEEVRQIANTPDEVQITRPFGDITLPSGVVLHVSAGNGLFNTTQQVADLSGLVWVESGAQWRVETSALTVDLANAIMETKGALEARSPFGRLTAGHMRATSTPVQPNGEGGLQVLFSDGVRLLYQPVPIEGTDE
ncbi:lptC [Ketogulonicigenium robustum]|uniref:LptC n=1 Tax=Ketogulonicigenium robustum TaxID=92947 RepID=A0A1W6P284_9RHOB|nr:LPS export ABC transporter periplasmic protein LptC [Ketogulonicigenium robustum]ARO15628.1 lptC [Ketogulonicigenium robustum]